MDLGWCATGHRDRDGLHRQAPWSALIALCAVAAMLLWFVPVAQAAGEELQLSPGSGSPGETVTASGSGWYPGNGPVRVFVDVSASTDLSNALASVSPDEQGNFSQSLIVPSVEPTAYRFFACQICVADPYDFPSATAPFTIDPPRPDLSITPPSGSRGSTVTAAGSGWLPSRGAVSVFADRSEISDPANALASVDPTEAGVFSTSFTVPAREPRDYLLIACQDCGNPKGFPLDTAPFTITAAPSEDSRLSLTPARGRRGETVTASGSGWLPVDGPVRVFASRSERADPNNALLTVNPSETGVFAAPLRVPSSAPGRHRFFACQRCGSSGAFPADRAAFTVTVAPALHPLLLLTPSSGTTGDEVTVSGSGWLPARGPVSMFARRGDITDPESALLVANVSGTGTFTTSLRVPSLPAGDLQLFACQACGDPDGFPSATAGFALTAAQRTDLLILGLVALALLVLAAAAGAAVHRHRVMLRRPRFEPRPDLRFDVESDPAAGHELPSLRLVPRDDESAFADQVEVRR